MRLRVRPATLADLDAIVALVTLAYRGEGSRAGWTTEADLLDGQRTDEAEVRSLVQGPSTQVLLAEDDAGVVVGSVLFKDEGDAGYVGMFAVRPTLQRQGLGRALLDACEAQARTRGLPRLRLTVLVQRSELIAWYERRGFRRTGHKEPFPYGDERFGVPRRPDLEFEVMEKPLTPAR